MNYPFILKFSSISNLSDARFAAGAWADFAGFSFDPGHSKYIEPQQAREIMSWISGPIVCGEFAYQPIEWISEFIDKLSLQAIQIPNDHPDETLFDNLDIKVIASVKDPDNTANIEKADLLLVYDKDVYDILRNKTEQLILLETEDLGLDAGSIDGIALPGVNEDKPGTRNHAEWAEFLEKWEDN